MSSPSKNRERYVAAVEAAVEEPGIDFKRAMSWSKTDSCDRVELVKDIGALCTYGGGWLIIGRNDEDKSTGSLTEEQAKTFETTRVNEFARSLLQPLPPIRVEVVDHDGDRLAILDVPGFAETPPCFQRDSQCGGKGHDGPRGHFRRGDVFIRTPAAQTARLCEPHDWRTIWNQVVRNIRGSVTFDEGMDDEGEGVEAEPDGEDTARSAYDAEYRDEEVNFRLPSGATTTVVRIELMMRPTAYVRDRIPRMKLKSAINAARASLDGRESSASTPFADADLRNTHNGVMIVRNCPELRECESGVFRTSGYLIYQRILPPEYDENNTVQFGRPVPFLGLALELKLVLEFAARLAQQMATDEEGIDIVVAVGGLANRAIEDDSKRFPGVTVHWHRLAVPVIQGLNRSQGSDDAFQ